MDKNWKYNEFNEEGLTTQKYNDAENKYLGDEDVQIERTENEEENIKKKKKKSKKKKWNKLLSKGSVSSFEGPSIVRRDSEHLRKLKHHFVNDVEYDGNEIRSYYKKGGAHDIIDYDIPPGDQNRKKKKKKKIIDLKKTSSKVGIVNQNASPSIQTDTFDAGVHEHTHERKEPSLGSSDKVDALSGSTVSLISSTKGSTSTNFKKPLRFCVWITRFPLISFCKYSFKRHAIYSNISRL